MHVYPNHRGTGLTNQLIHVIFGIIYVIKYNKSILILDEFRLDAFKDEMVEMKEILDLDVLNKLFENIKIYDKSNIDFKILKVLYGNNNYIDITNEIIENFYNNNTLTINKDILKKILNIEQEMDSDKKLVIEYKLYDDIYKEEHYDLNENNLKFDLKDYFKINSWNIVFDILNNNNELYDYFIKNFKYNTKYYNIVDNLDLIDKDNNKIKLNAEFKECKINVIHLRLEFDWIYRASGHNMDNYYNYLNEMSKKYIKIIENEMKKEDKIIILCYDCNNPVISYLKDNNYNYYFSSKHDNINREPNAIVDMILGEKCNNIFIGYCNIENNTGSTFSIFIHKRLNNNVKSYFIE